MSMTPETAAFFAWLQEQGYNPGTAYQYARWPAKLLDGAESPLTPELLQASLSRYSPASYSIAQAAWRAYRTYQQTQGVTVPPFPPHKRAKAVVPLTKTETVDRTPMRRFLKQLGVPAKDLYGLRWGHLQDGVRAAQERGGALPLVSLLYGDGKRSASLVMGEVQRYREWAWPALTTEDEWPLEEAPLFPEAPESLVPLARADLETLYSLPLSPEESASLPFPPPKAKPTAAPAPSRFSPTDLLSKL